MVRTTHVCSSWPISCTDWWPWTLTSRGSLSRGTSGCTDHMWHSSRGHCWRRGNTSPRRTGSLWWVKYGNIREQCITYFEELFDTLSIVVWVLECRSEKGLMTYILIENFLPNFHKMTRCPGEWDHLRSRWKSSPSGDWNRGYLHPSRDLTKPWCEPHLEVIKTGWPTSQQRTHQTLVWAITLRWLQ